MLYVHTMKLIRFFNNFTKYVGLQDHNIIEFPWFWCMCVFALLRVWSCVPQIPEVLAHFCSKCMHQGSQNRCFSFVFACFMLKLWNSFGFQFILCLSGSKVQVWQSDTGKDIHFKVFGCQSQRKLRHPKPDTQQLTNRHVPNHKEFNDFVFLESKR